jgi:hypothetical protein
MICSFFLHFQITSKKPENIKKNENLSKSLKYKIMLPINEEKKKEISKKEHIHLSLFESFSCLSS